MLQSLTVENYALIDHLEMALDPRLNIITGETGAGKSILLGALGLLLGNKNDGSAIKDNAKSCVVEGMFDISTLNLKPLFDAKDWDWEEHISIRRTISPSGKSRAFVGDIPVTLADLKELGINLIDIHSQHQNQILQSEQFRTEALDLVAKNGDLLTQYSQYYRSLLALKSELATLENATAQMARDQEWITYQVEELVGAKLIEGESEEIEAELVMLENADRINEALSTLRTRLDTEEVGILVQLKSSQNELRTIAKSFKPAEEYGSRIESVIAELKDINSSVSGDCERVECNPERLQKLSDRLGLLYSLCQKHRAKDLAELITIRDDYSSKLNTINNSDEQLANLKSQISECQSKAMAIASKIESKRKSAAQLFAKEICHTLSMLGMSEATIDIRIERRQTLCSTGINSIDFLFSSNKAFTPQPIDKIASGGEISRVMLSLKALLAKHKDLPTIIFDEIDTGVSGQIADAMGEIIASLSTSLQVIDITHLPQVAAKGETHFVVYKDGGRTNVKLLDSQERINQIATMISGANISSAALEQARILLSDK
ncbi:MAG: DNA repair protein RecN [Rikenellaceae bacterium]